MIQHAGTINDSLIPLVNKINLLIDRFLSLDPSCLKAIKTWRVEVHQIVNNFCKKRRQQLIDDVIEKQKEELDRLQIVLDELMREQTET